MRDFELLDQLCPAEAWGRPQLIVPLKPTPGVRLAQSRPEPLLEVAEQREGILGEDLLPLDGRIAADGTGNEQRSEGLPFADALLVARVAGNRLHRG